MRKNRDGALWAKELKELGWEQMLLSRLGFHGTLREDDVAEYTRRSIPTVRKHFRRLVESGKARADRVVDVGSIVDPTRTTRR